MEMLDLREIVVNCVEILKPKAAGKNVSITIDADGAVERVRGNKFLAEEILFNIIDNAISYNTPSGSVSITLTNRGGRTSAEIRDTGIGIPRESMERIFERFYRVDKSRSRETGGTGLGLSIVKHAADIMNWEISVASNSGGTTFTVLT
jgi:two-component system phosphate regulon sensor histidine kinase PhoR